MTIVPVAARLALITATAATLIVLAAPLAVAQCSPTDLCITGSTEEAVNDAVDEATGAIDEAEEAAGSSVDSVLEATEDLTGRGGSTGDPPGGSGDDGQPNAGDSGGGRDGARGTSQGPSRPSSTPLPAAGTGPNLAPSFTPGSGGAAARSEDRVSVLQTIGRTAAEAAKRGAFPAILVVIVGAFLLIQGWIDRKDPKLAIAPVHLDQDFLSFT